VPVKKIWLVYVPLLYVLLGCMPVFAQDTAVIYRRPVILKTNIYGPFSLFIERKITPQKSLQLSVQRVNFGFWGNLNKFFSLTPEMKFYLIKRPVAENSSYISDWYVSPYLKYRHVRNESHSGLFGGGSKLSEVSYHMIGGGAIVGVQRIFLNVFTVEAFGGAGYFPLISGWQTYGRNISTGTYTEEIRPKSYQLDIRFGLCLGYAFK
jgi:hypothetical protein